jgi:outer membrane lipopolysaccharide assembly protein LptE/RlpB|tara:strand:- start:361 stop:825 length:465 start_codon:yes stop_codon:yes gene_type:complete
MLKKILTIILFISLSSCGYKAMYSIKNSANYDFFISELTFIGDRVINIKMKTKLNNYTLVKKDKNFIIKISSSAEKTIIAKDTAGDATSFRSTIKIDVQVTLENDLVKNLQIVENFTYDNITNQFDLKKYEREIKINLTETATEKLIFKLSNMQ